MDYRDPSALAPQVIIDRILRIAIHTVYNLFGFAAIPRRVYELALRIAERDYERLYGVAAR